MTKWVRVEKVKRWIFDRSPDRDRRKKLRDMKPGDWTCTVPWVCLYDSNYEIVAIDIDSSWDPAHKPSLPVMTGTGVVFVQRTKDGWETEFYGDTRGYWSNVIESRMVGNERP